MQFSYKSHSFAVCGIQETCTKMRACTWLFTVCRTAATWGSSARLLGQGCVPVSWVLDGAGSALCSCELGRWMHQTCFRQVLQNLCEVCSAVIASIMSLRCQPAAAQLTRAMALETALFPPHTITSTSSDYSLRGFSTCSMIQLHCSVFKLPLMIQLLGICSASQCSYNNSKSSSL